MPDMAPARVRRPPLGSTHDAIDARSVHKKSIFSLSAKLVAGACNHLDLQLLELTYAKLDDPHCVFSMIV